LARVNTERQWDRARTRLTCCGHGYPFLGLSRAESCLSNREDFLPDFERVSSRYGIASRLEDALDMLGTDDVTATMLLDDAVLETPVS